MKNKGEYIQHAVVLVLANYKSKTMANWLCLGFSAVFILAFVTSVLAQTPTLRANGKIAFTSDRDGNLEIYVMNPDGSNQVRITSNNVVDGYPTWSPDGRKIAFVSQKQNGSFAIFTMNADGTDRTEITALNDSYWAMWRPLSWSPDGGRIAFHDSSAVSTGIDIFVVNLDGSGRQNLTADHAHLDLTPTWSPDGSKILFSRNDVYPPSGYGGTMLHTINVDGTNLTRLVNGFADGWNEDFPDWSPAVNKIVYSVNRWDFVLDLYIANPDGTGRQFFHGCDWTDNSCRLDALTPAFSPDGTKIAFSMYDFVNNTPQKLYVKNLDGTGLTLLTNNGASPSWQPLLPPTACPNPIDCADFFVRQHYLDFLSREPDQGGWDYWTERITSCGSDQLCVRARRIVVSDAFFFEPEFQETGGYVYRIYKASFGLNPTFAQFQPDRAQVVGGANLDQAKTAFVLNFVQRAPFVAAYPAGMTAQQFVDKLVLTIQQHSQVDLSGLKASLIALYDGTNNGRAAILREVADNQQLIDGEYNRLFVLDEYFAYLRRDPEPDGYNFWLGQVNRYPLRNTDVQHAMVCSFITSEEYQLRFGSTVTHTNAECPQ
jgi:Tol biopolymer transport system component